MQQQTQRAFYCVAAPAEHMGINLRGFHIAMAELFLHSADIGTGFKQVGGDKFIWNEFEQPQAGPQGKLQGCSF